MSYREPMRQNITPETFEARLQRALERPPEPAIPANFAARVAASLPPPKPARKPMRLGRTAGLISIALLAVAMFVLAPFTSPTFSSVAFDVELLALVQMAAISYWVAMQQEKSR